MVHRRESMANRVIGVIGGSGLYDLPGLAEVAEVAVETPFGPPSDRLVTGRLGDTRMVFLPRHGRGHRVLPHEVNARANLFALKTLGVEWLLSISAVGSMREEIRPGDLVVVDQFLDRTNGRPSTFFGDGVVAHVGFADPVSPVLSDVVYRAASAAAAADGGRSTVHRGGTYVCINGPQFSTRAESESYRALGVSVIGMTAMPEAKLAREAEISYATLALATDYDCWHASEEAVTVEAVLAIVKHNAALARDVVRRTAELVPATRDCPAASALAGAVMTDPQLVSAETRRRLEPILGKYLPC
jgi:5'-methylthioadenosine phosphorylase